MPPNHPPRPPEAVRRLLAHARDTAASDWGWSLRRTLPTELRDSAAGRVGKLGLITVATLLVFCLLNGISLAEEVQQTGVGEVAPILVAVGIALALSVAIFGVSRWKRDEPHVIIGLALPYQVVMAAAIGVCEYGAPCLDVSSSISWSGVAVWIIIFAVFVPGTPARTLVTCSVAALMDPLALVAMILLKGEAAPDGLVLLAQFGPTALAVATAVVASSITFRLGSAVHDARQMGSYRLVERLGKGGMGEVWRAEHERLARPAALKLIQPEALARPGSQDNLQLRFQREAQATALLQSEHTIELYDFGVADDGTFYYVMELLDGLDLDEIVRKFGPMTPARAVHCLLQVCESLAEAHARGLVHRDIKPSNVYLCRRGLQLDVVKVLDFGLVKAGTDFVDQSGDLTTEGVIRGTPAYLPPEILQGSDTIDGRTDLYAVGCLAWWLLTGRLVFEASNPMMMAASHLNTAPPELSEHATQAIPDDLEALILQCLSKDPRQRPSTATELATRLSAVDIGAPWDQESARLWWQPRLDPSAESDDRVQLATTVARQVAPIDTQPVEEEER